MDILKLFAFFITQEHYKKSVFGGFLLIFQTGLICIANKDCILYMPKETLKTVSEFKLVFPLCKCSQEGVASFIKKSKHYLVMSVCSLIMHI